MKHAKTFNFIIIFILYFLVIGCEHMSEFPLDSVFFAVEEQGELSASILRFRRLPLDSAVVNYGDFPDIFSKGFGEVFEDSLYREKFEEYCALHKINLYVPKNIYVIVAVFHKRLNEKDVDIEDLKEKMWDLWEQTHYMRYKKMNSQSFK